MTGTADGRWSTTSWGWADDDGRSVLRDAATHRIWKVDDNGEHRGFVVLPADTDTTEVHLIAVNGFDWDVRPSIYDLPVPCSRCGATGEHFCSEGA